MIFPSRISRSGAVVALFPLVWLMGCSHKTKPGYEGYVEGKFVYVASPQSGRLDRLAVTRGETIDASHPLFTLESEPEVSGMRQASETLRADEARLADLRTGKRPPEIEAIRAQLEEARAERQKSIELLASYEKQYAAGGMAETDVITARAAVQTNSAIVRQYERNIEVAELPGREQQIKAQGDMVASDRAALQQAQWKLEQKQVSSPRAGLVFDTLYREGEWVSTGSPIVQLLPPENIEVRFFVPEAVVGGLKAGQTVKVHCDGCSNDVPASITFISTQVEYTPPVIYSNENRSKLVFMVIAKPDVERASQLHPGQPLEVTLQ